MGPDNNKNIYCYKGVCPSNYEASNTFREKINQELANDGLVWTGDIEEPSNVTNQADRNEIKFIAATETNWGKTNQKIEWAYERYFRSYETFIAKLEEKYEVVDTEVSIDRFAYPEEHRELYKELILRFVDNITPLIDELYILQTNPKLIKTRERALADLAGDPSWEASLKFLSYNIVGKCPEFANYASATDCSLYPVPPDAPSINALMPFDISVDEWAFVDEACREFGGANPEALRPDTVVEWKTKKPTTILEGLRSNDKKTRHQLLQELFLEIMVTELPDHPVFKENCARLAVELHKLADLEINGTSLRKINPALAMQFETAAIYFEKGDLGSATEAMRWSIKEKEGPFFEVTPGSESYWPGPKHWAWSAVGQYVKETQAKLDRYLKNMVITRECRDTGAGCGLLKMGQVFEKVINVLSFGGALTSSDGTTAGWNKFNYPFPGLTDHDSILVQNVFELLNASAQNFKDALFGEYAKFLTQFGIYGYVAAHENGHSLLEGDDIKIISDPKTGNSAKAAFGKSWLWYKEARADLHVATTLRNILEDQSIDFNSPEGKKVLEDVKDIFFSYIYFTIRSSPAENDLSDTREAHEVSSLVRNGWWLKTGLYKLAGEGGKKRLIFNISPPDEITREELLRWLIITEKMDVLSTDLVSSGDVSGYLKFLQKLADAVPKDLAAFVTEKRKLLGNTPQAGKKRSLVFKILHNPE